MSFVTAIEAPLSISNAIKKASRATGVDFSYLLKTAARESAFNKSAKAKTSSAAGLFQFIESTWLKTVKDVGDKFGLEKYTPHIFKTRSGRYYVPNQKLRNEILQLRHNPEISAMMAGAFTQQNSDFVESRVGREPSAGELYIAHFLGPNGATKLISLAENRPNARADRHFPAAARANKPIFYSRGRPRTVAQVYKNLVRHHQKLEATAASPVVAQNPAQQTQSAQASPKANAAPAAEPVAAASANPSGPPSATAPLAQHFKKAVPTTTAAQQPPPIADKPLHGSPARQVIPSEQDLQTLTHKVRIPPPPPQPVEAGLGAGVETEILEPAKRSSENAVGLLGQKAAPIARTGRVAALTGNRAAPVEKPRSSAPLGSIGSWTTIVHTPGSQSELTPLAAPPLPNLKPEPVRAEAHKPEVQERPKRRPRAPTLLEQSAQRSARKRSAITDPVSNFRSDSFWDQMALNAS